MLSNASTLMYLWNNLLVVDLMTFRPLCLLILWKAPIFLGLCWLKGLYEILFRIGLGVTGADLVVRVLVIKDQLLTVILEIGPILLLDLGGPGLGPGHIHLTRDIHTDLLAMAIVMMIMVIMHLLVGTIEVKEGQHQAVEGPNMIVLRSDLAICLSIVVMVQPIHVYILFASPCSVVVLVT